MRLAAARRSVSGIMPWILEELEPKECSRCRGVDASTPVSAGRCAAASPGAWALTPGGRVRLGLDEPAGLAPEHASEAAALSVHALPFVARVNQDLRRYR